MAYTKTPVASTYQTKQLQLINQMNSRGSSSAKDVSYLNCYPEYVKNKVTQQQEIRLRKRSGSSAVLTLAGATTRGAYYWEDTSKLFVAQDHDLYVYTLPAFTLSATLANVFPTTTTGEIGFTEFLYDDGSVKLVVTDGVTLSTVDSANTVVAGSDPDMPAHLPKLIYLDGYLFLVKTGTADIYNSNLNDPLAFTSGDFIAAEMFPDTLLDIRKLNNYIVVFGTSSVEYYWDAANETGSPLQRNDTPVKLAGIIGGVAQLGNKIYWIGDNNMSQACVFMMEDFKVTQVSDEFIRRFLTAGVASTIYANIVSIDGHDFYVMYVNGYTYVLELETNIWHKWGWASLQAMDIQIALNCRTSTTYNPIYIRLGTGIVYQFSESLYQDAGNVILVNWTTDNEEFDTFNNKYMSTLTIWADKPSASSTLIVQWTDDDYQTFNTGVTVDLYQECPRIYRLGRFRRRAFRFTHTANQPLRVQGVEVDINLGQA